VASHREQAQVHWLTQGRARAQGACKQQNAETGKSGHSQKGLKRARITKLSAWLDTSAVSYQREAQKFLVA